MPSSVYELLMKSAGVIDVTADLLDIGGALKDLSSNTDAVDNSNRRATGSTRQLAEVNQSLSSSIADVVTSGQSLTTLAGGLAGFATAVASERAKIRMDELRTSIDFASGGTSLGAQNFSYLTSEVDRLALALPDAAQGFSGIVAAARGSIAEGQGARQTFTAIAQASKVLGLSQEATNGVLLASGQILSKGKIQAEEFRGQIGERLPIALATLSKALGKSTAETTKLLDTGKLGIPEFLKFINQLEADTKDGLAPALNTTGAALARFNTKLEQAKRGIAEGGLDEVFKFLVNTGSQAVDIFNQLPDSMKTSLALSGLIVPAIVFLTQGIIGLVFHVGILTGTYWGLGKASEYLALRGFPQLAQASLFLRGAMTGLLVPLGAVALALAAVAPLAYAVDRAFKDAKINEFADDVHSTAERIGGLAGQIGNLTQRQIDGKPVREEVIQSIRDQITKEQEHIKALQQNGSIREEDAKTQLDALNKQLGMLDKVTQKEKERGKVTQAQIDLAKEAQKMVEADISREDIAQKLRLTELEKSNAQALLTAEEYQDRKFAIEQQGREKSLALADRAYRTQLELQRTTGEEIVKLDEDLYALRNKIYYAKGEERSKLMSEIDKKLGLREKAIANTKELLEIENNRAQLQLQVQESYSKRRIELEKRTAERIKAESKVILQSQESQNEIAEIENKISVIAQKRRNTVQDEQRLILAGIVAQEQQAGLLTSNKYKLEQLEKDILVEQTKQMVEQAQLQAQANQLQAEMNILKLKDQKIQNDTALSDPTINADLRVNLEQQNQNIQAQVVAYQQLKVAQKSSADEAQRQAILQQLVSTQDETIRKRILTLYADELKQRGVGVAEIERSLTTMDKLVKSQQVLTQEVEETTTALEGQVTATQEIIEKMDVLIAKQERLKKEENANYKMGDDESLLSVGGLKFDKMGGYINANGPPQTLKFRGNEFLENFYLNPRLNQGFMNPNQPNGEFPSGFDAFARANSGLIGNGPAIVTPFGPNSMEGALREILQKLNRPNVTINAPRDSGRTAIEMLQMQNRGLSQ